MVYKIEDELKARMKRVGLTSRELANVLREPPTTVRSRLNGFMPLHTNHRRAILEELRRAEDEQRLTP